MKTIVNTYIEVTSQEQADRLKQICLENDLPIWNDEDSFLFDKNIPIFNCSNEITEFWCMRSSINKEKYKYKTKVTESEWLELLKQHKCTE
jgi:hypothetical protein